MDIRRNGKSLEFPDFHLIFASSSSSEDLFDEFTDILNELKSK
jgi:hypothetical protein